MTFHVIMFIGAAAFFALASLVYVAVDLITEVRNKDGSDFDFDPD